MTAELLTDITIFVLALLVGFEVISKVPATLHTPLMSAANSGKCEITVSSRSSRPSACAKAAAVAVKLLLSEYSNCGRPALYGAHHPSATTRPCRTTIRLCISMSGR